MNNKLKIARFKLDEEVPAHARYLTTVADVHAGIVWHYFLVEA